MFAGALKQLMIGSESLEGMWHMRKLKLDLCLQLRMFEAEAVGVLGCLRQWADEMKRVEISESEELAEGALAKHQQLVHHMHAQVCMVLARGQELLQLFTDTGVYIMADGQCDAVTRVQLLLEALHQKELDLEDVAEQKRLHIEQVLQLVHFKNDAKQVRVLGAL